MVKRLIAGIKKRLGSGQEKANQPPYPLLRELIHLT